MIICPVQIESDRGFFGKFQELEFLSLQGITAGTALSDKEQCAMEQTSHLPGKYILIIQIICMMK